MLEVVRNLFNLLTSSQRKRFYVLQILLSLTAILEIVGIASIVPFIALVGDMDRLNTDTIIGQIYQSTGISSQIQFVFILGSFVLLILCVSSIVSMYSMWKISMFAFKLGTEISDRLYQYYMQQNLLFHASATSAELTKKIATETQRVTGGVIMPIMQINARIFLVICLTCGMLIYDPMVALVGLATFSLAYIVIFIGVRRRILKNGQVISKVIEVRFRLMNEGFGGIKDLLILGREEEYVDRFSKTGQQFSQSLGANAALAHVPKYLIELLAFGSMIALLLYLIANHEGNLSMILPVLSAYAITTFKLLPALQQLYASFAIIKGNISAFKSIEDDLVLSTQNIITSDEIREVELSPTKSVSIENVTFTYPEKNSPAIVDLSMNIPIRSITGIVGPSGCGKSTLIDIILCLIKPESGCVRVDDELISLENERAWRNLIGVVSQDIFLTEGTIAQNVAFGIPNEKININRVKTALDLANLNEFVGTLESGLHTKIGERGVQLSGGQKQRIGIARALYQEVKILIFDEATSSLDGLTEKMIMDAIETLRGDKTIILIAHRLKTIQNCNQIFFLENGRVSDSGTYQDLIENNINFQKLANYA